MPSTDQNVAHWIDHFIVLDQDGAVVAMRDISPDEETPSLFFHIPPGTTSLTPSGLGSAWGLFRARSSFVL